jgi:hypothetical protein
VIYALRHPTVLLGLVLGFLIGVMIKAALQRAFARRATGGSRSRLHAVSTRRRSADYLRPSAGWAAYLDPYGTVAAALSGAGWGTRPPSPRRASIDVGFLVIAVVVHGALAAVGFAAFAGVGGELQGLGAVDVSTILHASFSGHAPFGEAVTLGFAMVNLACGLLALLPLPPLELGIVLWSRLPRSPGARRLAYRVLEEPWGVAIVLLLLLVPLAGQQPLLLVLIDDAARPILEAL